LERSRGSGFGEKQRVRVWREAEGQGLERSRGSGFREKQRVRVQREEVLGVSSRAVIEG
jgi:hypothetical protein